MIDNDSPAVVVSIPTDTMQAEEHAKHPPDACLDHTDTNVWIVKEVENEPPICRICHCSSDDVELSPSEEKKQNKKKKKKKIKTSTVSLDMNDPFFLISPCFCSGTLQYVHHDCLQKWIRSSNHRYCELCKYNFKLIIKNKPIYKWECLHMSPSERRKLVFHLAFNLISMICVFWSIYVIAERATHEFVGKFGWKFWLKMIVVTIGFICGIMFIFFQLRLYVTILCRWKQYNQIVLIENACKTNSNMTPIKIDITANALNK